MTSLAENVTAALQFIEQHGRVTFPQLEQWATHELGMDVDGDVELTLAPNWILWAGMSQQFADLVCGIQLTRRTDLAEASTLDYLWDGGKILALPVAKQPPRDRIAGYRTPRWSPTVLHMKD